MSARVAVGDRPSEVREVVRARWRHVRAVAAVRPPRSAPDRDHHLKPVPLSVPHEIVEVAEPVGRIERVRPRLGAARGDRAPVRDRADHRRVSGLRAGERSRSAGRPAERRVVVESDRHPRCGRGCRRRDCNDNTECQGRNSPPLQAPAWAAAGRSGLDAPRSHRLGTRTLSRRQAPSLDPSTRPVSRAASCLLLRSRRWSGSGRPARLGWDTPPRE